MGFNSKSEQQQNESLAVFNKNMEDIDALIKLPYAIGDQFTMADIMIYTFFVRIGFAEKATRAKIPEECKKLKAWIIKISERPSAQNVRGPDSYYEENLKKAFM